MGESVRMRRDGWVRRGPEQRFQWHGTFAELRDRCRRSEEIATTLAVLLHEATHPPVGGNFAQRVADALRRFDEDVSLVGRDQGLTLPN